MNKASGGDEIPDELVHFQSRVDPHKNTIRSISKNSGEKEYMQPKEKTLCRETIRTSLQKLCKLGDDETFYIQENFL